jgi:hypothetical protein
VRPDRDRIEADPGREEGDPMKRGLSIALAAGALFGTAAPQRARAEDPEPPVVEEILGVLRERGLLDPSEHDRLVTRYQAQEEDRRNALPRIRLSGDLRLRGDGFWYDEDEVADESNRYRGRYRLRIAATADVNDHMTAFVRLASGEGDLRSTNTSFGRPGPDFDPDPIFLDRASLEARAPEHWLPDGSSVALEGGKQPNPFVWKHAPDVMLWDNDIMPEGLAVRGRSELARELRLFANAGYFILDENSSSADPHLIGVQLGGEYEPAAPVAAGLRATWYGFRSLDGDFLERGIDGTGGSTSSAGNLPGLIDGAGDIDVGELGAYATWKGLEGWPVTVFGYVSNNFSARSLAVTPEAGDEALAWAAGLEVGDRKHLLSLGFAWMHVEANAFPSQFIDSDFLDGVTNREGFAVWGSRQILPNTLFNVSLFVSDAIEDALPDFEESVAGSERLRLMTDLVVSF